MTDTYWNAVSVPLTKGYYTLIDVDDYNLVTQRKWQIQVACGDNYYARSSAVIDGKRKSLKLHRLLLNAPDGMFIDHINMNGLDNRKSNLRVCTRSQNNQNKPASARASKSPYKGVQWYAHTKCWHAMICVNNKRISLKYHQTEEDAALAYNEAAKKYHGEFAYLNNVKAMRDV